MLPGVSWLLAGFYCAFVPTVTFQEVSSPSAAFLLWRTGRSIPTESNWKSEQFKLASRAVLATQSPKDVRSCVPPLSSPRLTPINDYCRANRACDVVVNAALLAKIVSGQGATLRH